MAYINEILDEFDGQLSIDDIEHKTYKEIGYLRIHRRKLNERKGGDSRNLEKMMKK